MLSIILTFFLGGLVHGDVCSGVSPKPPEAYIHAREIIKKEMVDFANSKHVAKLADETLGKLINAQSPMLDGWLKKRDLVDKDPDDIAHAWREYFAETFVLMAFPSKDKSVNGAVETLMEKINSQVFSGKFINKMEAIFGEAQRLSLKKIGEMKIEDSAKKAVTAKVGKIKLHWMKKFSDSNFKNKPLEYIDWGIAYDPSANTINMGVESLKYSDDETIFAVFAHEIAHSFDSCRWGQDSKSAWPFKKVGECLRSAGSVHAFLRDDSALDKLAEHDPKAVDFFRNNLTCNNSVYPPIGVQSDQLPESFADWFSAEVLTLKEFVDQKVRADLCETKPLNAGSSYVSNRERLDGIYLANPILRKKVGLLTKPDGEKPLKTYCTF